ncbi:MAG: (d)CMP kinase [Planctomycetota bacterium]|nr:MAG: (d)CMP kinase [Planctomycetota bacterium]
MIVTIDGPAGVGKSTAARRLAERLGYDFLDTGAMYRAVAVVCLERNWDPAEVELSARVAREVRIETLSGQVLCNGVDFADRIRTPTVSQAASIVAQNPDVREALVRQQRDAGCNRDIVTEGRDQGTIVFPHAECKFFLTAEAQERALRRHRELSVAGHEIEIAELMRLQKERDDRDEMRSVAPLKPADDAVIVDTTGKTPDEVLDELVQIVRTRQPR